MSTPTPGPWRLTADPYPDGTPYFRISAGDAFSGNPETCGFEFTAIMREADARLIIASPKLLAALREYDRLSLVIESAVRNADPRNGDAVVAAILAARAAIAEAEGKP